MLDDDGKLKRKFINKKSNAKQEGILFLLSFEQFQTLITDANLKSSDLGFSGNRFDLARYNDTGNYEVGNCRFISHAENMKERVISEATKEKLRRQWDGKRRKMIMLICPSCAGKFERRESDVNFKKRRGQQMFCSRQCIGKSTRRSPTAVLFISV